MICSAFVFHCFFSELQVVQLVEQALDGSARLDADVRQLKMCRDSRTLYLVFSKWEHVCKLTAPMRRAVREAAYQKGVLKDWELVGKVRNRSTLRRGVCSCYGVPLRLFCRVRTIFYVGFPGAV